VDPLNPISFPDLPFYLTPGDRADFERYIGMHFASVNFLPYLEQGGRTTWTRTETVLTQGVTISPLKGLSIKSNFSYNLRTRNYQDAAGKVEVLENADLAGGIIIGNGLSGSDWIENRNDHDQYYVFNAWADYTAISNGVHNLTAMVGFNQEWGNYQYVRARAFSLITPLVPDLNATTGNQETYGGKSDLALRGAFYRVNYSFKDRYLLEVNGRYDGTSRFPEDDRFGFFPSFSAGWRINNEAFMSNTSEWLDNLKLRASYGTLGNQLLFDQSNPPVPILYPYIPTMASSPSPYMMAAGSRIPTVSAAGLVSPTLTWETVVTRNLGIDFTILGNRLDLSFDMYARDTKDMLTSVEYPAILGTSAPDANAADLRTTGWELAATWQDRIKQDWNYSFTLALADNKSEITKYDNPTGSFTEPYYVGHVIGERWGFVTEGIFQTDQEAQEHADQSLLGAVWRAGDIKYKDLNGDGKITRGSNTLEDPGDQTIIAIEAPRYTFGLNGSLGWKGISLSVFFQGVWKVYRCIHSTAQKA
jgi:TonB-linked SusC/RagA family outer membrane protein